MIFIKTILLLLCSISIASAGVNLKKEALSLSDYFIELMNTNDANNFIKHQAPAKVYRQIAPTQMKGKGDKEVMELVNKPPFSFVSKLQSIIDNLNESKIDKSRIEVTSSVLKKLDFFQTEYYKLTLNLSYEYVPDTLILEAFNYEGKFYLIDIANDDKELLNIITQKGRFDFDYYFKKGKEFKSDGHWTAAEYYFTEAEKLDKSQYELYYHRAYTYVELENANSALSDLIFGINLNPKYSPFYEEMGYVYYYMLKDSINGILNYKKALFLNPNSNLAAKELVSIYKTQLKWDSVAVYSKKLYEIDSTNELALNESAQAWKKSGNTKNALESYEMLVSKFPNPPNIYDLAWYYNDVGDFDKAVSSFAKLFANIDEMTKKWDLDFKIYKWKGHYELGYALKNLGKWQDAMNEFEKCQQLTSDFSPKLWKHKGDCCLALGDDKSACEFYNKAKILGVGIEDSKLFQACK